MRAEPGTVLRYKLGVELPKRRTKMKAPKTKATPTRRVPRVTDRFWRGATWGSLISSVIWLAVIYAISVLSGCVGIPQAAVDAANILALIPF